MKRIVRKGCKVFTVHLVNEVNKEDQQKLENISVLKEFASVFPEEVPGLPPRRELYITIELMLGVVPISKARYRMNIIELNELKSQLKELIDKE